MIFTDDYDLYEEVRCDEYDFLKNSVRVLDFKITVENDLLYEVISSLEQRHRDIIYLSLCEGCTDLEIGNQLGMTRSNVQRIKHKIKQEIYNALKEDIVKLSQILYMNKNGRVACVIDEDM